MTPLILQSNILKKFRKILIKITENDTNPVIENITRVVSNNAVVTYKKLNAEMTKYISYFIKIVI